MTIDSTHPLRQECCGQQDGYITTKSGQDVVRCVICDAWDHNAPKVDTGREARTVATRPDMPPKRRARILDACGNACVVCGNRGDLQIGHLISRAEAELHGFLDEIIDSDDNLAAMCPECNLGYGRTSVSARLVYRVLIIKQKAAGF